MGLRSLFEQLCSTSNAKRWADYALGASTKEGAVAVIEKIQNDGGYKLLAEVMQRPGVIKQLVLAGGAEKILNCLLEMRTEKMDDKVHKILFMSSDTYQINSSAAFLLLAEQPARARMLINDFVPGGRETEKLKPSTIVPFLCNVGEENGVRSLIDILCRRGYVQQADEVYNAPEVKEALIRRATTPEGLQEVKRLETIIATHKAASQTTGREGARILRSL